MKDYFDYIGDYIDNKLSAQERAEFEVAMEKDADLKQAVGNYDLIGMIGDGAFEEDVAGIIFDELENSKNSVTTDGQLKPNSFTIIKWIAAFSVLFIIGYLINKSTQPQLEIQYADLYEAPSWPTQRGGATTPIEGAIELHLNNDTRASLDSLKLINTTEANYWITEIFAEQETPDSVLFYAPTLQSDKVTRDRLNYLKILAHYSKGDKTTYRTLINNLPKNTDPWYLEKYGLIE